MYVSGGTSPPRPGNSPPEMLPTANFGVRGTMMGPIPRTLYSLLSLSYVMGSFSGLMGRRTTPPEPEK